MTLCPVNVTFSGTGVRGVWGDTVQSITERYVIWLTSPSLPNGSAGSRRGLCPPRGEPSRVPPGAGSGTSPAAPRGSWGALPQQPSASPPPALVPAGLCPPGLGGVPAIAARGPCGRKRLLVVGSLLVFRVERTPWAAGAVLGPRPRGAWSPAAWLSVGGPVS